MAKKAKKKELKSRSLSRKELLSSPQSYRSLFFGVATVIILFLIGFGITRLFLGNPSPEISEEAVSTQSIEEALRGEANYTVQEGDTLWSIAEEKYGSGFEWYRIADANNITDRWNLEAGTNLVVPTAGQVESTNGETMEETPTSSPSAIPTGMITEEQVITPVTGGKITGSSYTVKEGDNLWDIAVRAYGDGYKWTEIATANNITHPDIIYIGTNLKLPR
jgi:nucleoid-associated protein YgaU